MKRGIHPKLYLLQTKLVGECLAWLLILERLLKIQSEVSHKKFLQSRFKRVYVVNHYSCCTYVNNQAKFIESRLILWKKLVWFGHLNCRKKIIFQQETIIYSIKILALFMVFEVFVIYYHKQKLFIDSLLVLSSQSLSFFVLFNSSQMYCLSKSIKALCFGHLLSLISMRPPCTRIEIVFLPGNLSWVHFIFSPATRTQDSCGGGGDLIINVFLWLFNLQGWWSWY